MTKDHVCDHVMMICLFSLSLNWMLQFNCSLPSTSNLNFFYVKASLSSSSESRQADFTNHKAASTPPQKPLWHASLNEIVPLPTSVRKPSARQYHTAVVMEDPVLGPSMIVFGLCSLPPSTYWPCFIFMPFRQS
jgi:hypothetical protein